MSKFLIATQETYRVDTEAEVQEMINEAKNDNHFSLAKYNCIHKERMSKGELIDEYFKLTLTKNFTDEKDPIGEFTVTYSSESEF